MTKNPNTLARERSGADAGADTAANGAARTPRRWRLVLAGAALALLAACGDTARLTVAAGTGPQPALPAPTTTLIPTVHVAPATGWPAGATPVAAPGLRVNAFARGLDHPRWLLVLPNGDVLVAETNAPARPDDSPGFKGWVAGLVMQRAGAAVPSANRITLLRDADGDGVAEMRSVLLDGLNSPFGMALVGNDLYVADTDAVTALSRTPAATPASRRRGTTWSTCRPARSTTTGRRTSSPMPTARSCT